MRVLCRSGLVAFAFAGWLSVATPACLAQQVWAEGGIGAILAGEHPQTHRPIYRKLYLAAVGPEGPELGIHHDRFRSCVKRAIVNEANSDAWWLELDNNVQTPYEIAVGLARLGQEVSAETLQRARNINRERVKNHFLKVHTRVKAALRTCGPRNFTDRITLGIVNRICTGKQAAACGEFPKNYGRSQFDRYSKVFEWYQTSGIRPVNEIVELGPEGLLSKVTARYKIDLDNPWPTEPSKEEAQRAFEASIPRLRRNARYYSYTTPAAIGLHKETAERLIDVIDHPAFSIPALPSFNDPAMAPLLTLQDEIARARIIQCVVYQVQRTASDASICAGYEMDVKILQSCLNGRECLPKLAPEAYIYAAEITAPRTLRELAATSLPRWARESDIDLATYRTLVQQCARTTPNENEATLCLAKNAMPEASALIDCASQTISKQGGGQKSARKCLDQVTSPEGRKLLECSEQRPGSNQALLNCMIQTSLSPQQRETLSCLQHAFESSKSEDAITCAAGLDDRSAKVTQCALQHKNDYEAMSLCVLEGSAVPRQVTAAVKCARQHNDDLQKFGGCLLHKELLDGKIGGEVGRGLKCVAGSGGSHIGVLTCMAAPRVPPEQQIALECLSQSADALSYAGCVGGRLTLKELSQCRHVDYGESGCYGPNNDIQKFLRSVGINAGPRTVVGRIAKLNVKIATAQLAMAESALVDAVKVADSVVRFVDGLGKALANTAKGLLDASSDVLKKASNLLKF